LSLAFESSERVRFWKYRAERFRDSLRKLRPALLLHRLRLRRAILVKLRNSLPAESLTLETGEIKRLTPTLIIEKTPDGFRLIQTE
jgi:hypothetical protein